MLRIPIDRVFSKYVLADIVKELDLSFAFVYRKRDFEIVLDMLGHERIDPRGMVTDCVGFESFPQAFESLKTPGEQIKIMLEPD